jgi:hypothetical protein
MSNADWREASLPPCVPGTNVHASCMTPILFFIVHFSWTTLILVVLASIVIGVLTSMGRDISWIARRLGSKARGQILSSRPMYYRRRTQWVQSFDQISVQALRR